MHAVELDGAAPTRDVVHVATRALGRSGPDAAGPYPAPVAWCTVTRLDPKRVARWRVDRSKSEPVRHRHLHSYEPPNLSAAILASAEVWDPARGWRKTGALTEPRAQSEAVELRDGPRARHRRDSAYLRSRLRHSDGSQERPIARARLDGDMVTSRRALASSHADGPGEVLTLQRRSKTVVCW